jgi:hypothetical protein
MLQSGLIALACSLSLGGYAVADEAKLVNIPPGDLVTALEILVKQSGAELVYQASQLKGTRLIHSSSARETICQGRKSHKILRCQKFPTCLATPLARTRLRRLRPRGQFHRATYISLGSPSFTLLCIVVEARPARRFLSADRPMTRHLYSLFF